MVQDKKARSEGLKNGQMTSFYIESTFRLKLKVKHWLFLKSLRVLYQVSSLIKYCRSKQNDTIANEGLTQRKQNDTIANEGLTQSKQNDTIANEGLTQSKQNDTIANEGLTQRDRDFKFN